MTDLGLPQKFDILLVGGELATRNWLKHSITNIGMSVRLLSDGWTYQDQKISTRPDVILIIAQSDVRTNDSVARVCQNNCLRNIPTLIYVGPGNVIPAGANERSSTSGTDNPVSIQLQKHLKTISPQFLPRTPRPRRTEDDGLTLAVNPNGRILWASEQVQRILNACHNGHDGQEEVLSHAIGQLLVGMRRDSRIAVSENPSIVINNFLYLNYVEHKSSSEILLKLSYDCNDMFPPSFVKEYSLTARECEVLTWLSIGKSNRAIALALALRPRTVDKYLEQIYSKLGIKNRTAAAALAIGARRNRT